MSVDHHKPVLVLLDLPAAFDTVDRNVFIPTSEDVFGRSGEELEWFQSHLEQRSQTSSARGIL